MAKCMLEPQLWDVQYESTMYCSWRSLAMETHGHSCGPPHGHTTCISILHASGSLTTSCAKGGRELNTMPFLKEYFELLAFYHEKL